MSFLYGFKGARSAPRAWRRVTAYAARREELAHSKSGREAPAGNSPHHPAAARLSAVATAAAAEADPGQLAAPAERRNPAARSANRAILPGAAIVEAEQDHRQGRL